jgi:hypothetical protein
MKRVLLLLILIIQPAHANSIDGRWQLTIAGRDQLEFGTEKLAGGVRLGWSILLDFTIRDGLFTQGSGTARLLPDITPVSRPEGMFDCQLDSGIFASSSGQSFATPHLRYQAFPMLGRVSETNITLQPHLEYPGNYYAILYRCKTTSVAGEFWLENSPRVARELGKQQNATISAGDQGYSAQIKEVKNIAPGPDLTLPIIDGLSFTISQEYGLRELNYHLERIADE